MNAKVGLIIAVLFVVVPSVTFAADQCVWFKGTILGTTYDMFKDAGIIGAGITENNIPTAVDAYVEFRNYHLFFSGDMVYGYNKDTAASGGMPWEIGRMLGNGYPVGSINAAMANSETDTLLIVSGRQYYYMEGSSDWVGPISLDDVCHRRWRPRNQNGLEECPSTFDIASIVRAGRGAQVYGAVNTTLNGKPALKYWITAGTASGVSNYWWQGRTLLEDLPIEKASTIESIDAGGQTLGRAYVLFGKADCQRKVVLPEPEPPGGVELAECKVRFYDDGFDRDTLMKKVSVKVNGLDGDLDPNGSMANYWDKIIAGDPSRCEVTGRQISCPCNSNTGGDLYWVSAKLNTDADGDYVRGGEKICKSESNAQYGLATYYFFAEDGLKQCEPERLIEQVAGVPCIYQNTAGGSISLRNFAIKSATPADVQIASVRALWKDIEARDLTAVKLQQSAVETDFRSQVGEELSKVPMDTLSENWDYYESVPLGDVYSLPNVKRNLQIEWGPTTLGNPQVLGDVSVVFKLTNGTEHAIPIHDIKPC